MRELLEKLERGTATPISTANRKSASYTYPGLSDALRFAARLKRMKVEDAQQETVERFPLKNA